jgi:hypothetical protein
MGPLRQILPYILLNGSLSQQCKYPLHDIWRGGHGYDSGRDEASESFGTESIREKTAPIHPFAVQRDLGDL